MSNARSVLAEVKSQRIEREKLDECLAELRKPWHAPFWILVTQLPWLFMAFIGFESKHPWSALGFCAVAAISIGGVVMHIRQRDRLWRELIRTKSPELLRELADEKKA